jgi:lipopolysaccharide transport system permease protein
VIFKQRVPEAQEIGFIVYLAIGFWPWLAFSDSILKSISVLEENNDLLGKVDIDYKIPVIAAVSSSFVLNLFGYIIVLIGLIVFADSFHYESIPLVLFPILLLYILAVVLGLFLSATQVFVKDVQQFVTTLITLWFFLTPILYSESILPEKYKVFLKFNPLYTPISFIHKALITNQSLPWFELGILLLAAFILLYLAIVYFNKLSNHFVDFI